MAVRSCEGHLAGQVAAVVVEAGSQVVKHVLLSRWREVFEYRPVPIGLVGGMHDGVVELDIPQAEVDSLPTREGA
jgi:hypothetical protein